MSIQSASVLSLSPSIHADDEDGVWLMAEGHHVLDAFTQAELCKRGILPEISWHETCSKYSGTLRITTCPSLYIYIYIKKCRNDTFFSLNIDELRKEVVLPPKKDHDEPCLAFSAEPTLGLSLSGLWMSWCGGDGDGDGTSTLTLKTWIVPLSLETASHLESGEKAML